jgi:2-polyprenyl-6-hydroxyphenyl methylase / 3-demethylubiquinone-9 3-methyltransferase
MNSTLSPNEIRKFEKMSEDWWNPYGKFKPLHQLNPIRLEYIINLSKKYFAISNLHNIKILDIGCGGGLVSEPLARLGAKVTGIDASPINIEIAKKHADNLNIEYQNILAEDLAQTNNKYQIILALEIIEHVEDVEFFIKTCTQLLEANGLIIFSTINQTITSFLQSIVAAEYILQWLPKGTHSWKKFIKPSYIHKHAIDNQLKLLEIKGLGYSLFNRNWHLKDDISNNYFIAFNS